MSELVMLPERDSKGRWVKGTVSPNPTGRPKVVGHIRRLAQQYGPEMIEVLYRIATDPNENSRVRVAAAAELLNRGYGRAMPEEGERTQPVIITGDRAELLLEALRESKELEECD
ncbi:MAG: hypothetical protein ACUVTO_02530 [Candidatus Caldatribacteriaceae bacterium]